MRLREEIARLKRITKIYEQNGYHPQTGEYRQTLQRLKWLEELATCREWYPSVRLRKVNK